MRLTAPASERRVIGVSPAARLSRVTTRGLGVLIRGNSERRAVWSSCRRPHRRTPASSPPRTRPDRPLASAAVTESADLDAAAAQHAQSMARSGILAHTPSLGSGICCWRKIGENVGEGPSVERDARRLHGLDRTSRQHPRPRRTTRWAWATRSTRTARSGYPSCSANRRAQRADACSSVARSRRSCIQSLHPTVHVTAT